MKQSINITLGLTINEIAIKLQDCEFHFDNNIRHNVNNY